jgi:hypothetical protein
MFFYSWLSQRKAFAKINGEVSGIFNVPYGSVQGSDTGSTLFSILFSQPGLATQA